MFRNNPHILFVVSVLSSVFGTAQNNTFSPYSRYGLGELTQPTFAHNAGMGGANIALKPDSLMPIFINAGNPASYALIRVTTLEVGGNGIYTRFKGSNSSLTKWSTNFAYGALGFPIRKNGGACFGIMPYSNVGYDLKTSVTENGIGNVDYLYTGSGGLNKAFIGYGLMPFSKRLGNFRRKHLYVPDSLKTLSRSSYAMREVGSELLSDLSIGFNVNYIFGSIENITRVVYPNTTLYNNTYRQRNLTMGDFTGNFGVQTAVTRDSVRDHQGRRKRIVNEIKAMAASGAYTQDVLRMKSDSLYKATPVRMKALQEKVKFTFGYFMGLNNTLKVNYNSSVYNYIINTTGEEIIRDTALNATSLQNTIVLPLEQGFGIGFKKGEKLNIVADFAITNWQNFKYLDNVNDLTRNYRVALGANFVPEKYAAGNSAFFKKINYRLGVSYQTGNISIKNTMISDYSVSAGLGLPVGIGRLSSMVNISVQYGQMGTMTNNLVKQNYLRFNFGFTFCDRWFQKYLEN